MKKVFLFIAFIAVTASAFCSSNNKEMEFQSTLNIIFVNADNVPEMYKIKFEYEDGESFVKEYTKLVESGSIFIREQLDGGKTVKVTPIGSLGEVFTSVYSKTIKISKYYEGDIMFRTIPVEE